MKDPKTWKIRSIVNLQGYCDYTINNEPSMTDPSQDETIEDLVARMMRGEQVQGSTPVYDYPNGVKPEEALNSLPAVERSGFDIADAPGIIAAATSAADALKQPTASDAPSSQPTATTTPVTEPNK